MIHSSHSRKDLLELCDIFNISIDDKFNCSKKLLADRMYEAITNASVVEAAEENYHIQTKKELITYLTDPHQIKSLSITDKQEIIKYCRQIIFYCDHNFDLSPHFDDIQHLKQVAVYISNFGDISTVRRALSKLQYDKKIKPKIQPVISAKVKQDLDKQHRLKCHELNSLRMKQGPVIVTFD
tara:strand:- start:99 stop:644 length:546 start_codon:yes stop_codon:yes gene_type:complete